jgi:hypothetical protein
MGNTRQSWLGYSGGCEEKIVHSIEIRQDEKCKLGILVGGDLGERGVWGCVWRGWVWGKGGEERGEIEI